MFLLVNPAGATELHVDRSRKNLVKFISQAPLDNFEGITSDIDGYVFWQGNDTLKTSEFYFEVDLNTIDTGIGLRNRHMRENYLETDKFRFARFRGAIASFSKHSEQKMVLHVKGTMTIHGVKQEMQIKGEVEIERGSYHLHTRFLIHLPDFDIRIPKLMFMKINETVNVELDFFLIDIRKK